jgi:macrolide transport system ATP-binding/permease protein
MNETSFAVDKAATLAPLIELRDVRKVFVTSGGVEVEALRNISLSIFGGEFVAIVGQSGSGKSTLMNLLGCLDRPTSGQYLFNGRDVSDFGRDELAWLRREAFGFVFQSYNLIGTATAVGNVEIPAIYAGVPGEERKSRAEKLLSTLGLSDRLDHRPNQLSGGQQQRVSIARALMNGGKVLLADEPTGALDSKSGEEVITLLRKLAADGHTIIIITHDREVAKNANRIIELKDGQVISDSGAELPASRSLSIDLTARDDLNLVHSLVVDVREALHMALTSLRVNLFRTVLTLLGIMIGVGSVVAMLAIGEGAKQSVIDRISSFGTNLLMVRGGGQNSRSFGQGARTLYMDDVKAIAGLEGVKAAIPDAGTGVTARYGDQDYQTQASGTTSEMPEVRNWEVAKGTFFTAEDEQGYAAVTVLGQTVVDNLFAPGTDPIGKYILLKNVPFLVIGVMSVKGAQGFNDQDDTALVPITTGALRLWGDRSVRNINVECISTDTMGTTQDLIHDLLVARHGTEDFRINNSADFLAAATETQNTMTILLGSIAAISLLVGGIGVMNIMLVSVTERTREIGIRMATGARTRNILQQFLTEATVVSALGGVIGLLAGIGVALLIQAFGTDVKFTAMPMILAFSCAAVTGLVFGFAPAYKASRLDPVVALASE